MEVSVITGWRRQVAASQAIISPDWDRKLRSERPSECEPTAGAIWCFNKPWLELETLRPMFRRLLDVGVILSLMWCDDIFFNVNMALLCFGVSAPHCNINHFETGRAWLCESQLIPCIGRNWIYLFIQSNNRMYFPGEMWVLHFTEQSGKDLPCMSAITNIPTKFVHQSEKTLGIKFISPPAAYSESLQ